MAQKTVWGFNGERALSELDASNTQIRNKIEKMRHGNDVHIILLAIKILGLILGVGFVCFFLLMSVTSFLPFLFFLFYFFFYGFITLMGLFFVYFAMLQFRSAYLLDNVNFAVAERFGLYYDAKYSREQWKSFLDEAYEIFQKGSSRSQIIDNQFYGRLEMNTVPYDCHFGSFVYQTGGKNKQTHYRHFFAFRQKKKLASRFSVLSENVLLQSFGGRKSSVELESNEFNKKFNIDYTTKGNTDIYRIMTPSIQELFLNMKETYGDFNALFAEDFVLFDFPGNFYYGSQANFKTFDIDPSVYTFFKEKIGVLLFYIQEIGRKLD